MSTTIYTVHIPTRKEEHTEAETKDKALVIKVGMESKSAVTWYSPDANLK